MNCGQTDANVLECVPYNISWHFYPMVVAESLFCLSVKPRRLARQSFFRTSHGVATKIRVRHGKGLALARAAGLRCVKLRRASWADRLGGAAGAPNHGGSRHERLKRFQRRMLSSRYCCGWSCSYGNVTRKAGLKQLEHELERYSKVEAEREQQQLQARPHQGRRRGVFR